MQKDLNGNVAVGAEVAFSESRNCFVSTRDMKKVVVIGMNDCIVAEKDDNLLICRMGEENRLRDFTE